MGVSGGGAFVIVYIACVVFVAVPILIAELWIGRRGGDSPPVAMRTVAEKAGRSRAWFLVGWMGMLVGYLIATYYSVIAGWTLAYIVKAGNGFDGASPQDVAQQFDDLLADPLAMTLWHTVFITIALFIVGRGLRNGIEKAVTILMPALFVMLLVMIGYAAVEGDFSAATSFLFSTDFSKIDGTIVLSAVGQAFFSISVAMGLIMTYGSYVPKDVSLTKSALIIAGADTLVALLGRTDDLSAGFRQRSRSRFRTGPDFPYLADGVCRHERRRDIRLAVLSMLAFAAVTSIIAIIEPIVAYAEGKWGMRRRNGCIVFGFLAWAIGLASVFSFNILVRRHAVGRAGTVRGYELFALIDYFTANLMMPLGGILMAVFVGWLVKPKVLAEDLSFGSPDVVHVWLWMIRVVAPLAILGVLYSSL